MSLKYSPFNIQYISKWNICIKPITVDFEFNKLIYEMSTSLILKLWDFENIDKNIETIEKKLPGYIGNKIIKEIEHTYDTLWYYYCNNHLTLYGLMSQTLYSGFHVFMSYFMAMIYEYCNKFNIKNLCVNNMHDIFNKKWLDENSEYKYLIQLFCI